MWELGKATEGIIWETTGGRWGKGTGIQQAQVAEAVPKEYVGRTRKVENI